MIKIPKLPMVEFAKKWYRAKVLQDAGSKVLLEYQGYSHEGGPFWLAKDHARIWRGSYKGRDWKYLVSGWHTYCVFDRTHKVHNYDQFNQRGCKSGVCVHVCGWVFVL